MNTHLRICWLGLAFLLATVPTRAAEPPVQAPHEIFAAALTKVMDLIEPGAGASPQTLSVRLEFTKADGLPKKLAGQAVDFAYQAPDRLKLSAAVGEKSYALGRDQQQLWIHAPSKSFGVVGSAGVALFASAPDRKDASKLGPFKLPLPREQLAILPLLMNVQVLPPEAIDETRCQVLQMTAKPEAVDALKLPQGQIKLWIRESDSLPAKFGYADGKKIDAEIRLRHLSLSEPWPADRWKLPARDADKVETVALAHLTRFISTVISSLGDKVPPLGPATGERRVVATEGQGRLERIDGTRVLFLKGSAEEMGRQHGVLLKKEIKQMVNRVLYGVGVGSSFEKGRWFFGEIELAQGRLAPFLDPRYLAEMDAMASATGVLKEEMRLANFFPELFHCSGFALFGEATAGGRMYHGRILDYLRGVGLEQNAVVIIMQPNYGNAWVNVSYAGFVGSVTAMNEKHLAIGEMGGRGEGNWDGKPMAQLVREVMEKANTIDEAVALMRKGPRTCEYYYVISDAKSKRAVGIAATPDKFETVWAGESHPQLPHAIKDAVLMSAGDRYEKLAERVQAQHGKIDAAAARDLMTQPVCMKSNIHSVLFEPDTLDFWVANADSENVASHARYTRYNLGELLTPATPSDSGGR